MTRRWVRSLMLWSEPRQRENTLIVFTSDNGGIESLENAYVSDVGDSPLNSENDPLRGQKNTLYEGGIRVCAFANWPSQLPARKHVKPMHVVDWFPTLAHLTGYQPPQDLKWDGKNQWSALNGSETESEPRAIYIATQKGHALRLGDWKLLVPSKGKPKLFNLADDPYEKHNLATNEQQRVAEMQRLISEEQAKDDPVLPADLEGLPG